MMRSLYTAATGMIAEQTQIDVTSHNIANVNTYGYKKNRAEFADLMYQVMEYAGTATSQTTTSPTGIEVGLGVRPTAINKIFSQGYFKETSDGYQLIPQITVPANATQISIGTDGTVSVLQAGETDMAQIGQIELANFINPAGLHSMGDNNYLQTSASGDVVVGVAGLDGLGTIRQGFVEMSNVQLVEEMTDLITGQRAYEANSKAITTSDSMLEIVNGLKR